MTKYNVSPLVARSITLHQCYIEATWKTRPKNDLDGNKEIFNSLQEYILREFRNTNIWAPLIIAYLKYYLYICSEKNK